ncbi:MAG: hypothetical protein ACUVRJ_07055 [Candidatus Villigracilaceae bacterium]
MSRSRRPPSTFSPRLCITARQYSRGFAPTDTPKGPAIFRLRDHAERLIESAEIFGFRNLNITAQDVIDGCKAVVKAKGFKDCYIRPLL